MWLQSPDDLQPALQGQVQADVVIVGGGYTGLSAALALRESGVDVVLLEMDYCGKGASGRNAGHLTPTIGKDLPTLVRAVGKQRALELAQFADRAVHYAEETIKKYAIDCDCRAVGNITAGLHPCHRAPLERVADLAANLDIGLSFLDEDEVRRRRLPGMTRFGLLEHAGGHLHPGKYVLGLRRAALAAGVRIYEQTAVTVVGKSSNRPTVRTEHGQVVSDKVLLATNAYAPSTLGLLKSRVFPLRVSLFQSRPLTPGEREAIGWNGAEGLYTAHESMESYRLTAEGRIVGGAKFIHYACGGKLASGYRPEVFRQWADIFKLRFQELPALEIETFWGGWVAMTLDFLPFSFAGAKGSVYYAMGYNGHGIAQATLNGRMIADRILGRPNPDSDLLQRRVWPVPPEPFRYLGVQAFKWYYDRIDRKVDADLRSGFSAAGKSSP